MLGSGIQNAWHRALGLLGVRAYTAYNVELEDLYGLVRKPDHTKLDLDWVKCQIIYQFEDLGGKARSRGEDISRFSHPMYEIAKIAHRYSEPEYESRKTVRVPVPIIMNALENRDAAQKMVGILLSEQNQEWNTQNVVDDTRKMIAGLIAIAEKYHGSVVRTPLDEPVTAPKTKKAPAIEIHHE